VTTGTPPALAAADRWLDRLALALAVLGAAGILVLMAITLVAVGWRYVLNDPIFGIGDLSVMTLTLVAGSAVAYGATQDAHVSVNVIKWFAGRAVTRWTDGVMRALTVGIAALAAYSLFDSACGMEKACITGNLSIEHRPFYYFLGVCMAVYALHVLVQLLIGLAHFHGEDPNEIPD
jgi:TRAP-type C4-dicarboxylate transport system permease small subunit